MRASSFIERQKSRLANTALAAYFEARKKRAEDEPTDPDMEYVVPNHDERRRMKHRPKGGSPYAQSRFRLTPHAHSTPRTGVPRHVAQWHHEAQVKRMLSAIPTTDLINRLELDGPMAKSVKSIAERYPNVWELTEARYKVLSALPGVGPKTLSTLKQRLALHQVTVKWQPPTRRRSETEVISGN